MSRSVVQRRSFILERRSTAWTRAMDTWRSACGGQGPICPKAAPLPSGLAKRSPSLRKVRSPRHRPTLGWEIAFKILLWFPPPAGIDYVGISRNLDFAPGVSMQTIAVTILDDLGQPELEGAETFELVLRMPMNGILGEPAKAAVFINDSVSDCKCCLHTHDCLFIPTFGCSRRHADISGHFPVV